jgi:hypothetical protein
MRRAYFETVVRHTTVKKLLANSLNSTSYKRNVCANIVSKSETIQKQYIFSPNEQSRYTSIQKITGKYLLCIKIYGKFNKF